MLTLLLVILALLGGFVLGSWCVIATIEKHCPTTWRLLGLELENNKRKRADAAREKEAQP